MAVVRLSVTMARKQSSGISPLTSQEEDTHKNEKPRKRSKKAEEEEKDEIEERRLTTLIFGGSAVEDQQLISTHDEDDQGGGYSQEIDEPDVLFQLDRTGTGVIPVGDEDEEAHTDAARSRAEHADDDYSSIAAAAKKPAWVDEDDDRVTANILTTNRLRKLRTSRTEEGTDALQGSELERRLRKRFEDTAMATARTDWARVEKEEEKGQENDDDEELFSSSAPLLASPARRLPPQILNVLRCPDANLKDPNNAAVQAVHFHPGSDPDRPLMLTAGLDKTLRFFQVDAEESQKIHGIHCE
jgi:hypothetical protein